MGNNQNPTNQKNQNQNRSQNCPQSRKDQPAPESKKRDQLDDRKAPESKF